MFVEIHDDFSLQKISASGQCFRCRQFGDGAYRFITGDHILYIRQTGPDRYNISCSQAEWQGIWVPYFDLCRDYGDIRTQIRDDPFMAAAAAYGAGIRILRQDPWETLITFIISQRKSIPAIKASVEKLAAAYGTPLRTEYEELHMFPEPSALLKADESTLSSCGLGYRIPYIRNAIFRISKEPELLDSLNALDNKALQKALKDFKGVGEKISSCVMLYAYGRTSCAPVDTWIMRIINKEYGGENPFPGYGDAAGILQQYAFYYAQQHKTEVMRSPEST